MDGLAERAEDDPRLAAGDLPEVAFGAWWYGGNVGTRLIGIAGFGGSRYGASRGKSRVAGGAVAGILGGSGAAWCSVAVRRVWALCCVRYTGRGAGLVGVVTVGQGFVGVALAAHAAQAQPTSQRLQATIDTVE